MNLRDVEIVAESKLDVRRCEKGFIADFKGVEIKDGHFLKGCPGRGKTAVLARRSLAKEISGRLLCFDADGANRRILQMPPKITAAY